MSERCPHSPLQTDGLAAGLAADLRRRGPGLGRRAGHDRRGPARAGLRRGVRRHPRRRGQPGRMGVGRHRPVPQDQGARLHADRRAARVGLRARRLRGRAAVRVVPRRAGRRRRGGRRARRTTSPRCAVARAARWASDRSGGDASRASSTSPPSRRRRWWPRQLPAVERAGGPPGDLARHRPPALPARRRPGAALPAQPRRRRRRRGRGCGPRPTPPARCSAGCRCRRSEPVALGEPGQGYPLPWVVYRWLPGEVPDPAWLVALARDLAEVVRALRGDRHRRPRFAGAGRGGVLADGGRVRRGVPRRRRRDDRHGRAAPAVVAAEPDAARPPTTSGRTGT